MLQKCDNLVRGQLKAKRAILALPTVLLGTSVAAGAATQDQQLWLQTTVNVNFSDRWRLSNETNVRFGDAKNGLYEIENILLLIYKPTDKISIGGGYAHDPQYAGGHFTIMERRAREQINIDDVAKIAGGSVSLRVRTEQRWRDGLAGTGWRLRPYVKYTLPLAKGVTLALWDESFVNLNVASFQTQTGFDRMRNAAFIRVPLGKRLSGEVGYLNQYIVVRGDADRMDHAATAAINASF